MKLGNTSQSNVPVPNFFLNKNFKQMETFQVSDGKKYFREKDLFQNTKDINFCNNPRSNNRKHENFNKIKYSPDMSSLKYFLKTSTNAEFTSRKPLFKESSNIKTDSYANFRNFMEKTNVANYVNPELKEEIKTNINVLIDRIKHDYDLEKWGRTDTRTNFIQTRNSDFITSTNMNSYSKSPSHGAFIQSNMNSTYNQLQKDFENMRSNYQYNSPKTEGNVTSPNSFNQTDASRFKTILRDKIKGMTLDKNMKTKLLNNIFPTDNSSSPTDKYYKTKISNFINIKNMANNTNDKEYPTQESFGNNIDTQFDDSINTIKGSKTSYYKNKKNKGNYETIHTNEININDKFNVTNICLPAVMTKYSSVSDNIFNNQNNIDKLRQENKQIYERFKDSNLFKDFPSPDKKEFIIKKGEKLRTKTRKDKVDKSLADFSKYNANKHKGIFCENYDTNSGFMNKFKKSKDTFV